MSEKPLGWVDDHGPGGAPRPTRRYTQHDPLLYPRFPDTEVPVPAEETPCLADPEVWFPTREQPSTREAKRVCSFCWMIAECREYGLAHPELDGIWGGLSQNERVKRRTARR